MVQFSNKIQISLFSMMKILLLILFFIVKSAICLVDPITLGTVAGLAALGFNFDTVKKYTYCKFEECCIDEYIPGNTSGLEEDLKYNLFGQHIVIKDLIPALNAHIKLKKSKKPLVISFHGTPGTGKNYVTDFIAKRLYKKGLESQYVHKFLGVADFPLQSHSNEYSNELSVKIRKAVKNCPRSLFIFDEVDKIPPGVFEALTSLLDHHAYVDGVDFRQAIFIFLSNTAGIEISKRLADLMKAGVWREHTQLKDFEKILEVGAYNLEGGFKRTRMIEAHVIDHYMPFLPLEKKHVEQCLEKEYGLRRFTQNVADSIKQIIDNYVTFDSYSGLFSTSGCKRLANKVPLNFNDWKEYQGIP